VGCPIHAGLIGNVQDGEAIQLQMVYVPRRSDLVSEWNWEPIEGEAIRLERLCDWTTTYTRFVRWGQGIRGYKQNTST
jgi:hypothetical protein